MAPPILAGPLRENVVHWKLMVIVMNHKIIPGDSFKIPLTAYKEMKEIIDM